MDGLWLTMTSRLSVHKGTPTDSTTRFLTHTWRIILHSIWLVAIRLTPSNPLWREYPPVIELVINGKSPTSFGWDFRSCHGGQASSGMIRGLFMPGTTGCVLPDPTPIRLCHGDKKAIKRHRARGIRDIQRHTVHRNLRKCGVVTWGWKKYDNMLKGKKRKHGNGGWRHSRGRNQSTSQYGDGSRPAFS